MSKRLYVGKLPMDARPEEVKSFFDGYGTMTDCRILTGFGFIEFESEKDADDVVRNFNGKNFMGSDIIVEFAKESRPRRNYEDRGGGGGGGGSYRSEGGYRGGGGGGGGGRGKPPGIRLVVTGVSRDTSWQDLKDFARQAGNVTFADIDRENPNQGLVEYATREEADTAIRELDGKDVRGSAVRVALDERRPTGGSGGGRERYGGGGGGGYDRGFGGSGRRDRSRSPRRGGGGYEDRRSRYEDDRGDRGERGERGDRGGGDRRERYDERDRERGDEKRRDDRDRRDRY